MSEAQAGWDKESSRVQGAKEWHSRGYLPHFDYPGFIQMLTVRLDDALPSDVLATLREEESFHSLTAGAKRNRIERYLDAGYGACWLSDPRIAAIVENAFLHFDAERYQLLAWVVMPNHVHVLIETLPGFSVGSVVRSWKSFTAREANKLLGRSGRFWQPDYFDRYIRDAAHLANTIHYIHSNPVHAGLATLPEEWPWSSAKMWME